MTRDRDYDDEDDDYSDDDFEYVPRPRHHRRKIMSNDENDEAYSRMRRGRGRRGRHSPMPRTMAPLYHETLEEKEMREHF